MSLPIAIQLYTVRDELLKDFEGTLKKVAAIGYKNVELAGLYNRTPQDVKKLLDGLGLKAIASHVAIDGTEEGVRGIAETAKVFGYTYIVSSAFPGYKWQSKPGLADWQAGVAILAKVSEMAKKHGLTYCYHNHSFEFPVLENGRRPIDLIFDDQKPPLNSELDIYWVTHGNDDPMAWMKKLSGRVPLLHVKDMAPGAERTFAEVGTGVVKIKECVKLAAQVGVKYLIVEQDKAWKNEDPILSAKISFENLSKMV